MKGGNNMDEMEIIEFENLPSNKTPINSVNFSLSTLLKVSMNPLWFSEL